MSIDSLCSDRYKIDNIEIIAEESPPLFRIDRIQGQVSFTEIFATCTTGSVCEYHPAYSAEQQSSARIWMSSEKQIYEIVQLLGSGGLGRVYLAKDRRNGRQVAVKTVVGNQSPPYLEREYGILSQLHHSNIIRVYDRFRLDGNLFFAMEKIDGSDLFRALRHSADGELRSSVAGVFGC